MFNIFIFQTIVKCREEFSDRMKYIYISTLCLYMIIIITFSTMVICTVMFKPKLHNSHNYLLMCLCITDLCVALVVIPFNILRMAEVTNCFMLNNKFAHLTYYLLAFWIQESQICTLSYLNIDKYICVRHPVFYRNRITNKKTFTILFVLIISIGTFYTVPIIFNITDSLIMPNVFILLGITIYLCLLCFVGLCLGIKASTIGMRTKGRWTSSLFVNILTINFIVVIFPVEIYFRFADNPSEVVYEMLRLVRYLQSVTNGMFIALVRPVYKQAFRVFFVTNPLHWKRELRYAKGATKNQTPIKHRTPIIRGVNCSKTSFSTNIEISNTTGQNIEVETHMNTEIECPVFINLESPVNQSPMKLGNCQSVLSLQKEELVINDVSIEFQKDIKVSRRSSNNYISKWWA